MHFIVYIERIQSFAKTSVDARKKHFIKHVLCL